jgi:hypothetical protein
VVPPCSDRISRVPPYSRIDCSGRIRGYHPLWPAFPDRSAYKQSTTGLLRVRSPLLAESLLMSFPPGTEMFQFPGFASTNYVFIGRYSLRSGLPHSDIHGSTPARGSPWLFAACHVLHRLLVPRHPPNALIALEITPTMHRSHPHPSRRERPAARQASSLSTTHVAAPAITTETNHNAPERIRHQSRAASTCVPLTGQTCDRQRAQRRTRT